MNGTTSPALTPGQDGSLHSRDCPRVPLSSARWHGTFSRSGLHGLFVWGAGPVGDVLFEPPLSGPFDVTVRPGHIRCGYGGGVLDLHTHPDVPVIRLDWTGERPRVRLKRSGRPEPGFSAGPRLRHNPDGWLSLAEWGWIRLRGDDRQFLALGASEAELKDGFEVVTPESPFTSSDPLLNSMFDNCLRAATSSRKAHADGRFAGLAAGINYCSPPRTYYRDSYWTVQVLLPFAPELVREQLLLLARGVAADGTAPSGVITAVGAGRTSWLARRAADPLLLRDHREADAWWSDHTDSPLYLVLMAAEVAAWTGDADLLQTAGLAGILRRVLEHQFSLAEPHGLPLKPWHDRDWADNVFRGGYLSYLAGLYHGALTAAAGLFQAHDQRFAAECLQRAARAREAAARLLVRKGRLVEFTPEDGRSVTERLSLDSLTAVRYGLVDDEVAAATLRAMQAQLETRNNPAHPWGDWGVMCLFPPYGSDVKRRAKSAFPWRYHNAAAWPYLEGLYAEQLLQRGDPDWYYALTRWWSYSLEQGWPAPVEYHSPPWPRGSIVNSWGAMPAAALLSGGFRLQPGALPVAPPWGDCRLDGVLVNGVRSAVNVSNGKVEVFRHG